MQLPSSLRQEFDTYTPRLEDQVKTFFLTRRMPVRGKSQIMADRTHQMRRFLEQFEADESGGGLSRDFLEHQILRGSSLPDDMFSFLISQNEDLSQLMEDKETAQYVRKHVLRLLRKSNLPKRAARVMKEAFTKERIFELLTDNPHHRDVCEAIIREDHTAEMLDKGMLEAIPARYVDLYPLARQMKRHFILHIGPTNSGKTHDAIEALAKAPSGIYLGPLRLLAYEQFDNLNRRGVPTSLVTGEEDLSIPGSCHQSSTVEMLNTQAEYDVAVIDEAQMIDDPFRGSSWTRAILGLRAPEIHICAAPHAEAVLGKLIAACGDTMEVVRHERMTGLVLDESSFHSLKSVRPKDALIVFSKKSVHAVASELIQRGVRCSVIYGALPYDVRHEEARKFLSGETDVVVATDAIGMGMNLPIRRIVFLETQKFDGVAKRSLLPGEVQQIAGRAGRFGIYDIGLYNALGGRGFVRKMMEEKVPDIDHAVITFPESLLGIPVKLSEILNRWKDVAVEEGFVKASVEREIALSEELERLSDDKELIYRFVTIPFDERSEELHLLWRTLFEAEVSGEYVQLTLPPDPEVDEDLPAEALHQLEAQYEKLDLMYCYKDRFGVREDLDVIMHMKLMTSKRIMKLLSQEKLTPKRCRRCGRVLSWNYPYRLCERCYYH